ncbi:MAG TPA: histidine kinase [Pyrinomonadaceae bacterium]|jgi:two-component sensor histidine kinase
MRLGRQQLLKWSLIFAGWTLVAFFYASQTLIANGYRANPLVWWRVLTWDLVIYYLWFLLTPVVLWLNRRFPFERGHIIKSLSFHLVAGTVLSLFYLLFLTLIDPILPLFGDKPDLVPRTSFFEKFQFFVVAYLHVCLISYWGILLVNYLVSIYLAFQERSLRASQLEASLAVARLESLKSQLHPHFLFNTLNAIVVLVRKNRNKEAEDMLTGLSELLRHSLENIGVQEVSLRHEIEFLKTYLEIEQVRFQDRLKVQLNIEPETLKAVVPNLILQPLVENAIRHGFSKREKAGLVAITTSRENGTLQIRVRDDGAGLPKNWRLEENKTGIGIANTRARLRQLYGDAQTFDIRSTEDGGTVVILKIPFQTQNGKAEKRENG